MSKQKQHPEVIPINSHLFPFWRKMEDDSYRGNTLTPLYYTMSANQETITCHYYYDIEGCGFTIQDAYENASKKWWDSYEKDRDNSKQYFLSGLKENQNKKGWLLL